MYVGGLTYVEGLWFRGIVFSGLSWCTSNLETGLNDKTPRTPHPPHIHMVLGVCLFLGASFSFSFGALVSSCVCPGDFAIHYDEGSIVFLNPYQEALQAYLPTYQQMSQYVHECMYACMYVCMYVCMDAWMHARMHACMHVCLYVVSSNMHKHAYREREVGCYKASFQQSECSAPGVGCDHGFRRSSGWTA